jgi:hypothetical protein
MTDRAANALARRIDREADALLGDDSQRATDAIAILRNAAAYIRQLVTIPWPGDMTTGATEACGGEADA